MWWLISTGVSDPEEADEDGLVDDDGADLYEEDEIVSVEAVVSIGVTGVGTKYVE